MGDNDKKIEKIGYFEIYKGLWKCRDFELAHYWQRAAFLTAFLLACYAGYGSLLLTCATAEKLRLPFVSLNGIAVGICLIGLVLSFLWIMMAKGSKAWYEHYEAAINAFVKRYEDDEKVFEGDSSQLAGFKVGDIQEFDQEELSSWLWSTRAGSFSVSKINIALGHISVLIWSGLILLHFFIAKKEFETMHDAVVFFESFLSPARLIALVCCTLLSFWIYSRILLKSSYFGER